MKTRFAHETLFSPKVHLALCRMSCLEWASTRYSRVPVAVSSRNTALRCVALLEMLS